MQSAPTLYSIPLLPAPAAYASDATPLHMTAETYLCCTNTLPPPAMFCKDICTGLAFLKHCISMQTYRSDLRPIRCGEGPTLHCSFARSMPGALWQLK